MSPDPDDTALEEALRGDLPSPETSARVRRRLQAIGLAVGNGLAVTTSAAAGSAGVLAKGAAISWGFKLGALAVVAIPTVGLLVDHRAEPQLSAPARNAVRPASPVRSPAHAANQRVEPAEPQERVSPEQAPAEPASAPMAPPRARPATRGDTPGAEEMRPSQVDFSATEAVPATRASSTLAEETRLLDGAFAELAGGNRARAGELLDEHQRRFPSGLLLKERERAKLRLREISRGE